MNKKGINYTKCIYEVPNKRTVILEKIIPKFQLFMKDIKRIGFTTEVYPYGDDFIILQQSNAIAKHTFGHSNEKITCVRLFYVCIRKLKEIDAFFISFTNSNQIEDLNQYFQLDEYGSRTGLLFIPVCIKDEVINSFLQTNKHYHKKNFNIHSSIKNNMPSIWFPANAPVKKRLMPLFRPNPGDDMRQRLANPVSSILNGYPFFSKSEISHFQNAVSVWCKKHNRLERKKYLNI